MPTGSISVIASVGEVIVSQRIEKTADHPNPYEVVIPAATAMATYLNDDDGTGSGTLTAGHGLTSGVYDLYWAAGIHYGATVTITDNAVSIADDGSGDALPADATPVVICKQKQINTAIDGDACQIIVMSLEYAVAAQTSQGHIDFKDATPAQVVAIELNANSPVTWYADSGVANPLTGNPITAAYASHGNVTYAATLKIATLEDSTP